MALDLSFIDQYTETKSNKLNSTENEVFNLLKENNDYTAKELAAKLNKTEKNINRALAKLKTIDHIRRNGSDKNGKWIVVE